jgi:regulator of nucleoside diphosphate kinase
VSNVLTFATLTTKDFSILENLLNGPQVFAGATMLIRRKLHAARLVFGVDIAPEIVTLNSRVRYRVNGGRAEERILVLTATEEIGGLTLRLDSPRGIALIGARAGETVEAPRRDGSVESLEIEAVLYQPEAHGARGQTDGSTAALGTISVLSAHRLRRGGRALPVDDGGDDPGPSAA